jgi:hypothetical protein
MVPDWDTDFFDNRYWLNYVAVVAAAAAFAALSYATGGLGLLVAL